MNIAGCEDGHKSEQISKDEWAYEESHKNDSLGHVSFARV